MATVNGILRSMNGSALQTALRFRNLFMPAVVDTYVVSAGIRSISSNVGGTFSITLEAGQYEVTWTEGEVTNSLLITVPDSSSTFDWKNLVTGAAIPPDTASALLEALAAATPSYFSTIPLMLSEDDGTWNLATTLNGYSATDGVRHTWQRIPSASGLVANGDSILSTMGGASLLVQIA